MLVATLTQDELTPNTAPIVAHELGARRAGAIDVGAACTAFLSGLALGSSQIEAGRAELVLLIGADFVTRITDYDDKRSAPLFADAAGAVVLGPGGGGLGEIGPIVLGADGSHAETIIARHHDRMVRMDGPEVFKHAVARMATASEQAVERAGLTLDDIDVFVYHQANARITRAVGRAARARCRSASSTASRCSETRPRRRFRWRSRRPSARVACDPERACCSVRSAPGSPGAAGVIEWGGERRVPEPANGCALVTGASRGIGAAIARGLAEDGWRVGINYRADRDGAESVVAEIERERRSGGRTRRPTSPIAAAADELFKALESEYEAPVLVLVNNAGISRDDLTPSLGDDDWEAVIDTDLTAAFRLTRRALKAMLRARSGRIVNISSVVGLRANPGQANYAAAKAGLIALTKTAAVEVARRGVTVNAVAPGWIDTEMTAGVAKDLLEAVPARRAGTPEEVAACVRFLASEQASYVTGAVLSVDGGLAA